MASKQQGEGLTLGECQKLFIKEESNGLITDITLLSAKYYASSGRGTLRTFKIKRAQTGAEVLYCFDKRTSRAQVELAWFQL